MIGTVLKVVQLHTPGDFLMGCRMCKHPLCTRPAQDHTNVKSLQCCSTSIVFAVLVLTTARLHLADLLHRSDQSAQYVSCRSGGRTRCSRQES